jgi:hypothetical protein
MSFSKGICQMFYQYLKDVEEVLDAIELFSSHLFDLQQTSFAICIVILKAAPFSVEYPFMSPVPHIRTDQLK